MFFRLLNNGRFSFAFRLAAACALLFGLLSFGGVTMLYHVVRKHMTSSLDSDMKADMRELLVVLDRNNLDGLRAYFDTITESQGEMDGFYRLLTARGETIAGSKLTSWKSVDFNPGAADRVAIRTPVMRTIELPDARHRARILEVRVDDVRYLQTGVSLEESTKFLFHLRSAASLLILTMLAGGTLIGWLIARRAMSGIRRITRSVERVTGGIFGDRVPVSSADDEVSQLGRTFNAMSQRVQAIMMEMRQMNSSIAHDLRSPITRIRGQAEMTMLTTVNPDAFADTAGSIIEECDRLLLLINTTLDIAEAEAGVRTLQLTSFDLADVAQQAVEIFRPMAEETDVALEIRTTERVPVRGEISKIQRAVANLIDNAVKFTPRGGKVCVTVSTTSSQAVLAVQDTGPGIAAEELSHVFDRFYRGDQSRHRPGYGLGLNLASAFIHAHGGELRVESQPGQGSTFTILLPFSPSQARKG